MSNKNNFLGDISSLKEKIYKNYSSTDIEISNLLILFFKLKL